MEERIRMLMEYIQQVEHTSAGEDLIDNAGNAAPHPSLSPQAGRGSERAALAARHTALAFARVILKT